MTADTIRRERLLLVERLADLPESQWETPSLCAGWSVRHVLAHLVTPFVVSAPAMAVAVTRHRGIGRAMDAHARKIAARPTEELLGLLRRNAASTFRPPGMPATAPLTDAVAHSADIRWALGDDPADWGDPERLRPVLDFLVSPRAAAGFVPPRRLRGIELVAQDTGWRHGSGELVEGPSLALALGALGRSAAYPLLTGPGVARLTT